MEQANTIREKPIQEMANIINSRLKEIKNPQVLKQKKDGFQAGLEALLSDDTGAPDQSALKTNQSTEAGSSSGAAVLVGLTRPVLATPAAAVIEDYDSDSHQFQSPFTYLSNLRDEFSDPDFDRVSEGLRSLVNRDIVPEED